MPIDLIIPFGILFIIVFYLMYSRATFEKKIVDLYEEKYENLCFVDFENSLHTTVVINTI